MSDRIKLITPVATPVVTLQEVKDRLHILDNFSDADLNVVIRSMCAALQSKSQRAIGVQTWQLALDFFPDAIRLPLPPLNAVTEIRYVDTTGNAQVLPTTEYAVDSFSDPGYVVPKTAWPATFDTVNAVMIKYECGYTPAGCPDDLRMWIFANIGHFHANREVFDENQTASRTIVDGLIDTYRIFQ